MCKWKNNYGRIYIDSDLNPIMVCLFYIKPVIDFGHAFDAILSMGGYNRRSPIMRNSSAQKDQSFTVF